MNIYFATDHAGFELKNILRDFVRDLAAPEWLRQAGELGYEVEDCGAYNLDPNDDYPDFIHAAAKRVAGNPNDRAIILGGSGQGEAMVANRYPGVRAVVYYGNAGVQTDAGGKELDVIRSSRLHNNANVLSLGARFISVEHAKEVVQIWLATEFLDEERHQRRIEKIDPVER